MPATPKSLSHVNVDDAMATLLFAKGRQGQKIAMKSRWTGKACAVRDGELFEHQEAGLIERRDRRR